MSHANPTVGSRGRQAHTAEARLRRGGRPAAAGGGLSQPQPPEAIGHDILIIGIKGLAGGALVVLFALLSETLSPKRFAGLFSAAPAVALVGLAITLLDKGPHHAHESAVAMIAGSAGMVAYAAFAIPLLARARAGKAAALALTAWFLVAGALAVPVLVT